MSQKPPVTKDYVCVDMVVSADGKRGLQVALKTKEFGTLNSRVIVSREYSDKTDLLIWNTLADEIIAEYEDRLNFNKAKKKAR